MSYLFMIVALTAMSQHISGAQFNPILTLSLIITKQITVLHSILYIVSQVIGSIAGGFLLYSYLKVNEDIKEDNVHYGEPIMDHNNRMIGAALELISMYALVFIYNGVFSIKNGPKHIHSISIASVYFFSIISFGLVSGGAVNMVCVLGPVIFSDYYKDIPYYLGGQISGALLSSLTFWLFILKKSDLFTEKAKLKGY